MDYLPILPPTGYGEGTQDGHFYGVFGQRFTLVPCGVEPGALCLGGRFRVRAYFTDPRTGLQRVAAQAIPLTSDTGAFWFFGNDNVELVLKVLDGGAVNGHFWVYYGALSDVQYTITVFDPASGLVAHGSGKTGPSGQGTDLASGLVFRPSTTPDSDGDGLPDGTVVDARGQQAPGQVGQVDHDEGQQDDPAVAHGAGGDLGRQAVRHGVAPCPRRAARGARVR